MKENFFQVTLILVSIFLLISGALADENSNNAEFSGYMFGDFYYVASNHNQSLKDKNGFWMRRIYLTFDKKIGGDYSVRLRLEMNNAGDFESKDALSPVVKDAYLQRKFGTRQLILGISSTPTFGLIEKVWGYRAVEKTPLDLQKMASSRDFGLAAKGNIDKDGKYKFHIMFANGSSNKTEVNKGKRIMGAVSYKATDNIIFEVYADYEDRSDSFYYNTLQVFSAYQSSDFRAGFQYSHQTRKELLKDKIRLASLFGVVSLTEKLHAYLRIDKMFDKNPAGEKISFIPFSTEANSTLIIAGVDCEVFEGINIMPNIEAVVYEKENDKTIKNDLIPRITFKYNY